MNAEDKKYLDEFIQFMVVHLTNKHIDGVKKYPDTTLHKSYSAIKMNEEALNEVFDLANYLFAQKRYIYQIEQSMQELKEKIKDALDICEEETGIRVCKNCGLSEDA